MTWETVIGGALQGISNFAYTLISIITGSLTPATIEGILGLIGIGIIIRLIDVGPKIPGKVIERIKKEKGKDDDEEWEYVMIRRKKK